MDDPAATFIHHAWAQGERVTMTSPDRWRDLGLTAQEWEECVQASRELAALHPHGRVETPEMIAAQLAVAKAAEQEWTPTEVSWKRLTPERP